MPSDVDVFLFGILGFKIEGFLLLRINWEFTNILYLENCIAVVEEEVVMIEEKVEHPQAGLKEKAENPQAGLKEKVQNPQVELKDRSAEFEVDNAVFSIV